MYGKVNFSVLNILLNLCSVRVTHLGWLGLIVTEHGLRLANYLKTENDLKKLFNRYTSVLAHFN